MGVGWEKEREERKENGDTRAETSAKNSNTSSASREDQGLPPKSSPSPWAALKVAVSQAGQGAEKPRKMGVSRGSAVYLISLTLQIQSSKNSTCHP